MIATHHWDDWTLDELIAARGDQRVSLVVPARNEAATVGDVVTRVREALVDTVALLDEIVVIDSDSTDTTYDVATDAGAVVHRSAEIRPDLGTFPGKGEAMWKSLFVTRGELIVFMDADLLDWDTHFVPGLLGPLLTDPGVLLVKGFYERPGRARGARGRPRHRAGRAAADRAAVPRAGRTSAAAGRGVGGAPLAVRDPVGADRLRRRAGRPRRHRRAHGPGRSPRSTSAAARTATSRCATSAGWPSRSWRPRRPAGRGSHPHDPDEVVLTQYESRDGLLTLRPRTVPTGSDRRRCPHDAAPRPPEFADDATLMMAIVNRTPDSFYDKGATWAEDKALDRVAQVVDEGAEIVDIGGIKAAPGVEIDADRGDRPGRRRFVGRVRAAHPGLVISVDTWRAEVGRAVCAEGADVLNDAWGGADPALVDVAAEHGAAIICTHTGGVQVRTRPYRIEYDDVVAAAVADCVAYAERAVAAGVAREAW